MSFCCVKSRVHCCVLCDVVQDLLLSWFKVHFFKAAVKKVLLCGVETGSLSKTLQKNLDALYTCLLSHTLNECVLDLGNYQH